MTARTLLAAALLPFAAASAPAQDGGAGQVAVKQVDWGFGGKVLPGQFAPVSILVDNPTREPFDGTARLYRANFGGQRRGAVLTEPLYLGPFASRRVQFYVIPLESGEIWAFEAVPEGGEPGGDGTLKLTLPAPGFPRPVEPQTVYLTAADDFSARVPGLPRMDETLFPQYPEATDGLRAVVLDHVPAWEAARQRSFLAWLKGGGVLHVLYGADGEPPRFGGPLAELNDPTPEARVGRGLVIRHARRSGEVTKGFAETALRADPFAPKMTVEDLAFEKKRLDRLGSFPISYTPTRLEEEILPTLRRMVRPEHRWGLIHILCLAYVAALFPGVFLVGRERRGYPATLGLLLAVTVTFGVALRTVGRRGYGESLSARSTALVRALPPGPNAAAGGGSTEITQWSDAFVTNGGDYTFTIGGEAVFISTGQAAEPVKGEIRNGADGAITADVPPFSSRAFVARTRRDDPAPPVKLLSSAVGSDKTNTGVRLTDLRLSVPPEFASRARLVAVHGRHVYPLNVSGGTATLSGADAIPLGNLIAGYGVGLVGNVSVQAAPYGEDYGYGYDPYQQQWGYEDEELTDRGLDNAARQLIGRDLGLVDGRRLYRLAAPEGTVRVYAVIPLRDADRVLFAPGRPSPGDPPPNEPLPNQNGTTIFAYELPL